MIFEIGFWYFTLESAWQRLSSIKVQNRIESALNIKVNLLFVSQTVGQSASIIKFYLSFCVISN